MTNDETTNERRHCAVLGSPISHSLSPVLHRAAYASLDLDWTYDAIEVDQEGLAGFLDGLDPTWRGLSLTMPLKRTVMDLLDEREYWALVSGVANTVVLQDGQRLGANTDVPGAIAALRERTDAPIRSVAVLGGGATATSVLLAAAELGAVDADILVRDPARAEDAVQTLDQAAPGLDIDVLVLGEDEIGPVDLLVSTIPTAAQTPELVDQAASATIVFDVVYDPWPTPLAEAATLRGQAVVSGLDLLVHQARLQVELMTGEPGPLAAMRSAGEAALETRSR